MLAQQCDQNGGSAIIRAKARVFGGPSHLIDPDSCSAPASGSITITLRFRSTLSPVQIGRLAHRQPLHAAVITRSRAIGPPTTGLLGYPHRHRRRQRATGGRVVKLSGGMEVIEELSPFKVVRQKSKLAGII
jgi:hypothetical protein